jgi:hypothetical protein
MLVPLLAFCLSAFCALGQAADSSGALRRIDESAWREATDGLTYTGEAPEPQPQSQPDPVAPWLDKLVVVLGFSLLGAALILLLWLVYQRLSPKAAPAKLWVPTAADADDPRHLLDSDLEEQLALAWREERFRDVLRFQFLAVMRALSQSGRIAWRPEKTNRDYELELSGQSELRSAYRRLSGVFEWSRYGDADVSRQDAERLSPLFNAFLDRLRQPASSIRSTNPMQQS